MSIVKADSTNFKSEMSSGLVLVDFYADWCGPCKMIGPVLEQVASERSDVKIVKLNVDMSPDVAQQYGVMSIPTLILFKDGESKAKTMGFQPKPVLEQWIDSNK